MFIPMKPLTHWISLFLFSSLLGLSPATAQEGRAPTPAELKEQERQLRLWADRGDQDAQFELGLRLLTGDGIDKNEAEGVELIEKAAQQEHLRAQHVYGSLFEDGLGVQKDPAKAFTWYLKAAQGGLSLAQHAVGIGYEIGHGTEKDPIQAAQWFQKAAAQNYPPAMAAFGTKLQKGEGVEKDTARAALLFLKASKLDYVPAMSRLAHLYYTGTGVPQDFRRAFGWYQRAARTGQPWPVNDLAWFLSTCPDETLRNGEQAVLIAKEALKIIAESGEDQRFEMLDTVAAAYARNGEFREAVLWQEKAIELLPEQEEDPEQQKELKIEFENRLKLYQKENPYIEEPPPSDGPGEPLPQDTILKDEGIPEAPPKPKTEPGKKPRSTVV
jgi:TPR repeat protein